MKLDSVTALIFLVAGCATPSVSREAREYIAHRPQLTAAEIDRIYQRTLMVGDPRDRLEAAYSGCEIERVSASDLVEVFRVHVPLGERAIGIGNETVEEGGELMITFERHRLRSFLVLEQKYSGSS